LSQFEALMAQQIVKQIGRKASKDCACDLKSDPIPISQQFAALSDT